MTAAKKSSPSEVLATPPAIAMDIDWSGQHVLVVGLGESGFAAARWLIRKGAAVTAIDSRAVAPKQNDLTALGKQYPGARISVQVSVQVPFASTWLEGITMLLVSPGLSPHACHQGPAVALTRQAVDQKIPVVGEIDLFEWAIHSAAHASSALTTAPDLELPLELPKVLAITGTNGKTTTTQMTVALLRRAGLDAQEAGNISPSLLDAVMAREDESRFPQVWVLELSSFQLAAAQHFHPTAAALLNVTEDHLDWHVDMQDYIAAKQRVFGVGIDVATSGVLCVTNRDDPATQPPDVRVRPTSKVVSFGQGLPQAMGDFGLMEEGIAWMCMRDAVDDERVHRLMPADALRVRGRHNALNALAALALCRAVTPALAPLLHGLREFRGGAHRMQWVAHVRGVDFVDDSKGTNVGATAAALQGLGLPVVLIAGGEGKGQDFSPLAGPLAAHAKAVVAIGKDGPAIAKVAAEAGVAVQAAASMSDAVGRAFELASPSGVVLMSPACASFDMFANYVERAHAFCDAVHQLSQEQGVAC